MTLLTIAFPWLLIVFGAWLFTQFLRQNGRILLRLESLQDQLDQMADHQGGNPSSNGHRPLSDSKIERNGLPKGTPAPEFRLPKLDGGEVALSDYRGKKVLLVFSDPHCGPCDALMPELEKAHRQNGDVQILIISRGEVADNRKKVKQHKLTFPIALQKRWEISKQYAMFATPIAYLIDEEGITLADVAVGAEAILGLLTGAPAKELATVS